MLRGVAQRRLYAGNPLTLAGVKGEVNCAVTLVARPRLHERHTGELARLVEQQEVVLRRALAGDGVKAAGRRVDHIACGVVDNPVKRVRSDPQRHGWAG